MQTPALPLKQHSDFPLIFTPELFIQHCAACDSVCSNGNRSWQSIKGVRYGTEATRELLLLTPALLPGPGGAASRDKGEFRLWALPFPVPPCSWPATAPGCARHDSGFYDVGTRQQATNLSQTKQPLDEDGCHYRSSAMLDALIQWWMVSATLSFSWTACACVALLTVL